MFQPDLFAKDIVADASKLSAGPVTPRKLTQSAPRQSGPSSGGRDNDLDLPSVLERLARISARPRYTFMVLNLIARAAGESDSAGPYIREGARAIPVRDWLSDALMPMAQRDARRLAVVEQVRADLSGRGALPTDVTCAKQMIADEVRTRLRHSGRTNVSRAVSDLVRAGLLHRHYQGYRVDHENRGAGREAVYTIAPSVKRALGKAA
ncbi:MULTISPECIES: hypothetical protein [unclassified Sphingomonas]|jgi:hypothetical protein|uniref:hypothetical protein n=1 Tax=unclassified Sphingomonas TaxID=196159 RepID=UPI000ABF3EAF|nr:MULTISPECIES: hypothetical protein [unclassified Sphingomonas]